MLGLALAAWVVLASAQQLVARLGERPGAASSARLRGIPSAWWGMWLAHLGVGIFIIGVTRWAASAEPGREDARASAPSLPATASSFAVCRMRPDPTSMPRVPLDVSRSGVAIATLHPEKRLYRAQGMPMTEADLDIGPFRDIILSLGEQLPTEAGSSACTTNPS